MSSIGHPGQSSTIRLTARHARRLRSCTSCPAGKSYNRFRLRFEIAKRVAIDWVLHRVVCFQLEKLNGVVGLCHPFIRRGKGSARGDFQGENRGLKVHDHRDVGGRAMPGAIAEDVL